jgi:RHH-type transcriptional regulator, proline utilization regulon repressor / proline dehydrogenase / delta 1-pyrroline-5-carboxylate dehydrogenase
MPMHRSRLPTAYRPEADIVQLRLRGLDTALDWHRIAQQAGPWVTAVRQNPPPFWAMESLLKEYPISSAEGLALMRLAEALLRVPDAETAIALTADQLGRADFEDASDATLARLSSAAIALSKKFLPDAGDTPNLLEKLGAKTVVAATLRAVALLGKQFVLGQTIEEARKVAANARNAQPQLRYSYDMLGEGARTEADAQRYLQSYAHAIATIAKQGIADSPQAADGISIKLSALHPRYDFTQHDRVMNELVPRVWTLCEQAAQANINLTIDAEEVDRLELSLDVTEALIERIAKHYPKWTGFGLAMQSYQTRAVELIEHLAALARKHGVKLMCRLVKGAYWDAEIKRAQEMGLPHYPVFTHKHHTDVSYLACARSLLAVPDFIYPQFATHNAGTIAAIMEMAARNGAAFELQRLHGMGEGIYREVLKNPTLAVRVYAPVGAHRDLLAYLVRRLLENGANSSFVHQLADESTTLDELLISPLRLTPLPSLPLPSALFGHARKNSAGLDLADAEMRGGIEAALKTCVVPRVAEFTPSHAKEAFRIAQVAQRAWGAQTVSVRANALRKAAAAIEAQTNVFCALLIKEAFKTWSDAVAEVREAVDFLRYYADEAERVMRPTTMPGPTGEGNVLTLKSRGVWVAISPWNFPLAIFIGQVSAALATGNTVLAKPAEQTPAVAQAMVRVMIEAGIPADALQLCHGPGETVGAALVELDHIAGVVFTGSTHVAKIINRALAAKDGAIIPLIAETGGINAMIVDSSALPEQVCDAVVQSAFRSAGQRCSALRLLCIHEAIADNVIEMISGAMKELRVGDATQLATDVGALIDAEAHANVAQHIARLQKKARAVVVSSSIPAAQNTVFPSLFEVKNISDVKAEIFGPVLQVVRWRGEPEAVLDQINALGFGLTFGIQTRIDSRAARLAARAHIGNVYVNRNTIGAVVGVQPFGGEGLSGTGPKAGGPNYLVRFCCEQTVTINTTAAGGNAALLAA